MQRLGAPNQYPSLAPAGLGLGPQSNLPPAGAPSTRLTTGIQDYRQYGTNLQLGSNERFTDQPRFYWPSPATLSDNSLYSGLTRIGDCDAQVRPPAVMRVSR
jgi:hypothetical protein